MWPYLVSGLVGVLWANSRKPKLKVTRSVVVGPKSGTMWTVEYLPEVELMVVTSGLTKVVFRKAPEGWRGHKAQGDPNTIRAIRIDFEAPGP